MTKSSLAKIKVVDYRSTWCNFQLLPQTFFPEKKFLVFFFKKSTIKKFPIFPQKNVSPIFQEMKLSSLKIIKVLIFSQKKLFLYFGKWSFFKKRHIFQEGNFQACKLKKTHSTVKKFLYFGKWNFVTPKLKMFLYFRREL